MEKRDDQLFVDEIIMSKIYFIRDQKVMIDRDLARLYNVETRTLNQAVRRNIKRFPEDFMFQMTSREFENWKSQFVITNSDKMGLRKSPLCFTEQGIAMLSSVLNSDTAIMTNIQIIRIFAKMRKMLEEYGIIITKLIELERKNNEQDNKLLTIFKYIKKFEQEKKQEGDQNNRRRIGY